MDHAAASIEGRTSRLTVFAFLWSCAALVHHEFFQRWLTVNDWAGWFVAVAALAVFMRPSSLCLFSAMLAGSAFYNIRKWPFVPNHILVETLIDLTILGTILWSLRAQPRSLQEYDARERLFDRFAPVLRGMLIVMYWCAILAKLNVDFFDPRVSCVAVMYEDLLRRYPMAPDTAWARDLAIWGTIAIEVSIPLLFTIRRTRLLALVIGLPFHFMLGTIGYRTFSALAFSMYGLFVIDELAVFVDEGRARLARRFGAERLELCTNALRTAAVIGAVCLIAAAKAGAYQAGIGPLRIFRVAWVIWGLWSLALLAAYFAAIWMNFRKPALERRSPAVRWLHPMVLLVLLNGMCQYIGLKTETSFTMYSNLRTEGPVANHFFIPAFRLAGYQDDLVDILETDDPELQKYIDNHEWMTWFELRRYTSTVPHDLRVRYHRQSGRPQEFVKKDGIGNDPELMRPHSLLASKLLYFRPVSKDECMPCQH